MFLIMCIYNYYNTSKLSESKKTNGKSSKNVTSDDEETDVTEMDQYSLATSMDNKTEGISKVKDGKDNKQFELEEDKGTEKPVVLSQGNELIKDDNSKDNASLDKDLQTDGKKHHTEHEVQQKIPD